MTDSTIPRGGDSTEPTPDPAERDAYFPSPYSLGQYVPARTDYDGAEHEGQAAGRWKILVVGTDERYLPMGNGRLFSTGNHPVETLLPLVHLEAAGFGIDVATVSGNPVKLEWWATPAEDPTVHDTLDRLLPRFRTPRPLSEVVNNGLDARKDSSWSTRTWPATSTATEGSSPATAPWPRTRSVSSPPRPWWSAPRADRNLRCSSSLDERSASPTRCSQNTPIAFAERLVGAGVVPSVGSVGDAPDNVSCLATGCGGHADRRAEDAPAPRRPAAPRARRSDPRRRARHRRREGVNAHRACCSAGHRVRCVAGHEAGRDGGNSRNGTRSTAHWGRRARPRSRCSRPRSTWR